MLISVESLTQEGEHRLLVQLRLGELDLGDRTLVDRLGVAPRDVSVAPGDDDHVGVGSANIGLAAVHRLAALGDVLLHPDHVVPHSPQRAIDRCTVLDQIQIGGGDVDLHGDSSEPVVRREPTGQ